MHAPFTVGRVYGTRKYSVNGHGRYPSRVAAEHARVLAHEAYASGRQAGRAEAQDAMLAALGLRRTGMLIEPDSTLPRI